jgi:hypothetical protein
MIQNRPEQAFQHGNYPVLVIFNRQVGWNIVNEKILVLYGIRQQFFHNTTGQVLQWLPVLR